MAEQVAERAGAAGPTAEGPPPPVRVAWATVPRVNLLPIEIIEGRAFRRTQLMLGAAVVGVVALAVAGTLVAQSGVDKARGELALAQSHVSTLQAQAARYAAVPQVVSEVEKARAARTTAMGTDVLWYRYLNDLDGARPAGVELTALSLTMSAPGTPGAAAAPSTDVLTPSGLGQIKLDGTAERYEQISAWLENLDRITGISLPQLVNASATEDESGESVGFGSQAVVDDDALSHRYDPKAG